MAEHTDRVVAEIRAEREKQTRLGWSPEHDDEHMHGELAGAAAAYAIVSLREVDDTGRTLKLAWKLWPWESESFSPGPSRRRELIKAAALLVAEIERLDREGSPDAR